MALDWPAFGDALWHVSDQLGIRPEWQIPVIALETAGTFDPAIMNPGGCVGLNQFCASAYSRYVHVPVNEYRAWPASRQLFGPIFDYWRDAIVGFGPIHSSVRLMLAQLGHALLKTTPRLDSVVFAFPSIEYTANAGFDTQNKGYVTVQDVANALSARVRTPAVRDAIARAYSMRPGEHPLDPVYGTDFGPRPPMDLVIPPAIQTASTGGTWLTAAAVLTMTVAAAYGASRAVKRSRNSN